MDLLVHQDDELFDRTHALILVCGGRGSGKSYTDFLHFFIRSDIAKDQPYGLFANTDTQLQTFVSQITQWCDEINMRWVYGTRIPRSWRRRWRRDGIKVPVYRKRNLKFLVLEDGTHIFTCSMVNNAYTRAKSLDLLFALIEEATEPGVTKAAITTILGCVRCGVAKKDEDGTSECERRGHCHQLVVKFNVPLNDPGHWIYSYYKELKKKEEKRRAADLPEFFRLIESSTRDNPHTGEQYDERLRAAMDDATYEEQTSGKLIQNVAALSYRNFSEANVLGLREDTGRPWLTYDEQRALHVYFDWNPMPAAVGWGHDLHRDEVPPMDWRPKRNYFGVIGELFSGSDTFVTEQVINALLLDPTQENEKAKRVCADCSHEIARHVRMINGFLCKHCSYQDPVTGKHCSGDALRYEGQRSYIHAPPNWHGLMAHRGKVFVYGDASGRASSSQGKGPGGNIKMVRDAFSAALEDRVFFRFKDANPPIKWRVAAMNRAFRDGHEVHSFFVADWCEAHIADFQGVVPDPKTGDPLKVSKSVSSRKTGDDSYLRTDISDAAGYMVDYRWPFSIPKADAGGGYVGGGTDFGPLEDLGPRP